MKDKRIIRIIIAVVCAISVFVAIRWTTLLLIESRLGDGVYAATVSLFSVMPIIASLAFFWLLLPRVPVKREDNSFEEEIPVETESVSEHIEIEKIDESEYPELFIRKAQTTEENIISYPDIKKIIGEQKAEAPIEEADNQNDYAKLWQDYVGEKSESEVHKDLYSDIPTELPEDYQPNYVEDIDVEEEIKAEEEAEEDEHDYKGFAVKFVLALLLVVLAIAVPVCNMTVYTPSGIKDYNLFGVVEYDYKSAMRYNVGVSLSGGLSVRVEYDDGGKYELIFDADLKSESFNEKFKSEYGYATFCDRLFKELGITKNVENLSALSRVPEGEMPYVEEITEGYINNN